VLADIIVRLGLLVAPGVSLEACVRHILLVSGPRDALVLQEIDDSRDICGDLGEGIL
jgi:hypothetical protein